MWIAIKKLAYFPENYANHRFHSRRKSSQKLLKRNLTISQIKVRSLYSDGDKKIKTMENISYE